MMLGVDDPINSWLHKLGLSDKLLKASPDSQNRYIWSCGRLVAAPMSPSSFLTTPLFTISEKIRVAKEFFIPSGSGLPDGSDETVGHFVRRRLGDGFLEKLIDPFVKGVYASHPDLLSVGSAFPLLSMLEKEHGGLIRGAIHLARVKKTKEKTRFGPSGGLYSFSGGLGEMVRAFSGYLNDESLMHGELVNWHRLPSGEFQCSLLQEDETIEVVSKKMIIATSPADAARILQENHPDLSSILSSIPMAPVAIAYVGVNRRDLPGYSPGFGVLFPTSEKRRILGIIQSSDLFPNRSPEGKVLLTIFAGGMLSPKIAMSFDEDFEEIVLGELKTVFGLKVKPEFFRIQRWAEGISQYSPGHASRIEKIGSLTPEGIALTGNYLGGISVSKTFSNGIQAGSRFV
jgi:oxygen-dependent protoporphyrinogen oxidase